MIRLSVALVVLAGLLTTAPAAHAAAVQPALPYRADWSAGLAGWGGSDDWSAVNGMLVSDGSAYTEQVGVVAPLELGATTDVVVEAQIRLERYVRAGSLGGRASFGVAARVQKNGDGYGGGHCISVGRFVPVCAGNVHGARSVLWTAAGNPDILEFGQLQPGHAWHTYRLEVRGNTLTLTVDGRTTLTAKDNRFLTGGRVGLWSKEAVISVRSFVVRRLSG